MCRENIETDKDFTKQLYNSFVYCKSKFSYKTWALSGLLQYVFRLFTYLYIAKDFKKTKH